MKKILLSLISILFSIGIISGQNILDTTYLYQLQKEYSIRSNFSEISTTEGLTFEEKYCFIADTCGSYFDSLENKIKYEILYYPKELPCEKRYNIPDSLFLQSYPFNADSIVVINTYERYDEITSIPLDSLYLKCDNLIDKKCRNIKMSSAEIAEFADNLFNYRYVINNPNKQEYSLITINEPPWYYYTQSNELTEELFGTDYFPISNFISDYPAILLCFFHKDKINYLGIYFDDSRQQIRMASSFGSIEGDDLFFRKIYLGDYCSDRNIRFRQFFKKHYNFSIISNLNIDNNDKFMDIRDLDDIK